jgi:apolipoprotein N-acyltransferase
VSLTPGARLAALLSLAAGVLAAVAHRPFGVLPGLLGYALLMALVDRVPGPRPIRSAFWRGWLAAFSYFLISCWWVAEAFMVDARGQGWMAPFAVMLLPAGLGLFWGAAMAAYRALALTGPWRVLAFAAALSLTEWLRGWVFTGFPWNLPGETWQAGSAVSQAASVFGAYGLTFVTLAVSAAPAALADEGGRSARITPAVAAVCALTILWSWGEWRLRHAVASAPPSAPVVRIVQANVPQLAKYDLDNLRSIFTRYVRLTAAPAARAPDVAIWSEGAIPLSANDLLEPGRGWSEAIRDAMHPGETLLMGAYRATGSEDKPVYFNSLVAVRATFDGLQLTGVYDKHRLVPFGEFLPAENLLKPLGVKELTHVGDSFTAGPPPGPIAPAGIPPLQPLICYESLFPDLVRRAVLKGPVRPRWIVNVSNDAWFGVTSGPLQHLNQASYRAIEEGLPIARVTPTGVSAMIDAYGRAPASSTLGFGREGVLDAPLPPALASTTYGRAGDWLFAAALVLAVLTNWRGITSRSRTISVTLRQQWSKGEAYLRSRKNDSQ